jgi:hypothetical protein
VHELSGIPLHTSGPRTRVDMGSMERVEVGGSDPSLSKAHQDVQDAIAAAEASAAGGPISSSTADAPSSDAPDAAPPAAGPPSAG